MGHGREGIRVRPVMNYVNVVTPVNAEEMYPLILLDIKDRCELFVLLKRILIRNPSLWFTPYGETFESLGGGRPPIRIPKSINYTVSIYNRYHR